MKIKISEVQIIPVKPHEGLVAFATFILCDCIYLGNVAIYTCSKAEEGYRLVFPTRKLKNGKSIKIFYPITDVARKQMLQEVLKAMKGLQ